MHLPRQVRVHHFTRNMKSGPSLLTSEFKFHPLQTSVPPTLLTLVRQIEAAQQYNRSPGGYAPLASWVRAHVERMHTPPGGHETLITLGGNHSSEVRAVDG